MSLIKPSPVLIRWRRGMECRPGSGSCWACQPVSKRLAEVVNAVLMRSTCLQLANKYQPHQTVCLPWDLMEIVLTIPQSRGDVKKSSDQAQGSDTGMQLSPKWLLVQNLRKSSPLFFYFSNPPHSHQASELSSGSVYDALRRGCRSCKQKQGAWGRAPGRGHAPEAPCSIPTSQERLHQWPRWSWRRETAFSWSAPGSQTQAQ